VKLLRLLRIARLFRYLSRFEDGERASRRLRERCPAPPSPLGAVESSWPTSTVYAPLPVTAFPSTCPHRTLCSHSRPCSPWPIITGFPLIGQLVGSISSNLVRLNKLVIVILVFCHWNGCFQFLLAQLDTPQYNETTGWPEDYPHGFHKDSWVVRLEIAELGPWQQWEWSFFTANLQMLAIAIGSVEPKRSIELWG
jgi:hypothetical protein